MIALSILFKVSLVIAVTACLQRILANRASAASRHLVWTLAMAGMLLLPIFSVSLPEWTAVTLTQTDVVVSPPVGASPGALLPSPKLYSLVPPVPPAAATTSSHTVSTSWSGILLAIYVVGLAMLAGRLLAERLALRTMLNRAAPVTEPAWTALVDECAVVLGIRRRVRVLRSTERTMPMTMGLWRSAVLLPLDADEWTRDRRRAVLLHELAHVARFDCLTQFGAACATAIYWPHPGVWWMARQLRVERELACDDCVLAAGADARDYAGHLLELAYELGNSRTPALAVPMAGSRQLEGRMLAVLDDGRPRSVPAFRDRLTALAVMLTAVVPLAAVTAKASPEPGDVFTRRPALIDGNELQVGINGERQGTWEVRPSREGGVVYLTWSSGRNRHSRPLPLSELDGLTMAQLSGAGSPLRFRMKRDAGTFEFEGVARNGVAAGTYSFEPDLSFPDRLANQGLQRPTHAQQRVLAQQDIGISFVQQFTTGRQSPPTIELLARAADHGIDANFVDGLTTLGYRSLDLAQFITLRDRGIDPDYVSGLAETGYRNLSLEQLLRLRSQGIDSDYIRELEAVGHGSLTLDKLLELRSRGIDADYITNLAEAGHSDLSLEELVRLRNHGVDADYVRELAHLGHASLLRDALITLRKRGIDPGYIRELAAVGYQGLSLEQLVELRSHGVDADYVRELAAASDQKLSVQTLIELRKRGVSGDLLRKLRPGGL